MIINSLTFSVRLNDLESGGEYYLKGLLHGLHSMSTRPSSLSFEKNICLLKNYLFILSGHARSSLRHVGSFLFVAACRIFFSVAA